MKHWLISFVGLEWSETVEKWTSVKMKMRFFSHPHNLARNFGQVSGGGWWKIPIESIIFPNSLGGESVGCLKNSTLSSFFSHMKFSFALICRKLFGKLPMYELAISACMRRRIIFISRQWHAISAGASRMTIDIHTRIRHRMIKFFFV